MEALSVASAIWRAHAALELGGEVFADPPAEVLPTYLALAHAAVSAMREPSFNMWDSAENVSMVAEMNMERLERAHPLCDDAFSFPTLRIWQAVMCWRAMISAVLGEPWDAPLVPFFDEQRVAARASEPPAPDPFGEVDF
jgi:hypothetical protein